MWRNDGKDGYKDKQGVGFEAQEADGCRRHVRKSDLEAVRVLREVSKTIKVRLLEPNKNKEVELALTLEAFREACSIFVRALEEAGVEGSKTKLRKCLNGDVYRKVREETKLPTVLTQNAADVAIEAYRSYKDRKKKHKKASLPSFEKMRSFRLDKRGFRLIDSDNRYRFLISLRLITKRVVVPLEALEEHYPYRMLDEVMRGEWEVGSVTVVKKKDGWWAHITITKKAEVAEITEDSTPVAVDVGTVNLAVVSTPGTVLFFDGREWWHRRRRWRELRRKLQKERKFRAIKKMGDKERRYNTNLAHKISRAIVKVAAREKNPVIVMEYLTNIRDDMDFSREQNYRNHGWFFRKLQTFIEYKATEMGIPVCYVSSAWTSATCPRCGDAHPKNRDRRRHRYKCQYCGYELNDDLIAARNIARLFKQVASGYTPGVTGRMTRPQG